MNCTIAIPVFNRASLIRTAVNSALAQKLPDSEILVVDNASTDETWQVLQSFSDNRLRLVRNSKNLGLFGNFNRCLELARGKYIRILCSDDKLAVDCVASEINEMERHPDAVLLSTYGRRVDEQGREIGKFANYLPAGLYDGEEAIRKILLFLSFYGYNPLNYPSGILFSREAAMRTGQFDPGMKMCGDVDFFLRMLEHGLFLEKSTFGCDIVIHNGQAGKESSRVAAIIDEQLQLIDRYQKHFSTAEILKMKNQLAAISMGLTLRYCNTSEQRRRAWAVGSSKAAVAISIVRLLALRILLKVCGWSILDRKIEGIHVRKEQ